MKANLRNIYTRMTMFSTELTIPTQNGQFQDQKESMRQWSRQPIAQFEENRMNASTISFP